MHKNFVLIGIVLLFLSVSGCETAKGMKKDALNTWHNAEGFDGWFQENLW